MVKPANNSEVIEASDTETLTFRPIYKKPHPMSLVTKQGETLVFGLIAHILYLRIS